jgi:hypothetical protein
MIRVRVGVYISIRVSVKVRVRVRVRVRFIVPLMSLVYPIFTKKIYNTNTTLLRLVVGFGFGLILGPGFY